MALAGAAWLLLTPVALMVAGISVMASDSGVTPAVEAFIFTCFALPVSTLAAAVGCFVGAVRNSYGIVALSSAPPFAIAITAVGILMVAAR